MMYNYARKGVAFKVLDKGGKRVIDYGSLLEWIEKYVQMRVDKQNRVQDEIESQLAGE